MRFVAALDTRIYGVKYLQGAEVDTLDWTRKQLLAYLNNGTIQASALTAGSITDAIDFSGNGVTLEENDEGVLLVVVDPALRGLADYDDSSAPADGDVPRWSEDDQLWRPGAASSGGGGGGGGGGLANPWVKRLELNLDTLTGWSVGNGTWSAASGQISQTDASTGARRLTYDIPFDAVALVAEVEVKAASYTGLHQVGFVLGSPSVNGTNGLGVQLHRPDGGANWTQATVEQDGVTNVGGYTLPAPISDTTYQKLRVVVSGDAVSIYVNDVFMGTNRDVGLRALWGRYLTLLSYGCVATWRNLKVWTLLRHDETVTPGGVAAVGDMRYWMRNDVALTLASPAPITLIPGMSVTIPADTVARTAFVDANVIFTGSHTNRISLYLDGVSQGTNATANLEGGNNMYNWAIAGWPIALSPGAPHVVEIRWNASDSVADVVLVNRTLVAAVPGTGTSSPAPLTNVALLEPGATIPPTGTPVGAVCFEKAAAVTTWDFTAGAMPAGWTTHGSASQTFSGSGMAGTFGAGGGWHIDGLTLPVAFILELHLLSQATISSVMFGPQISDGSGNGGMASWYNSPNTILVEGMASYGYNSAYQMGVGTPAWPVRLRVRKSGTSYWASYSLDGGASWSAETASITHAAVISRLGIGSCLGGSSAVIQRAILRPGAAVANPGLAKGWWDGAAVQPLA